MEVEPVSLRQIQKKYGSPAIFDVIGGVDIQAKGHFLESTYRLNTDRPEASVLSTCLSLLTNQLARSAMA